MNTTNNSTTDACDAAVDWSCPTPGLQFTYWTTSVVICGFGLCMLGYTFREYKRNDAMKLPMVKVFYPMLFGDLLFTLMYFPYHLYNVFNAIHVTAQGRSIENLVADSPFCRFSWFVVSIATGLQVLGLVIISYAPYRIIQNSRNYIRNGQIISAKAYKLLVSFAVLYGIAWFISGVATDHIGDFSGIYCAASSWDNEQGAILFTTIAVGMMFMLYFFGMSYVQLRSTSSTKSSTNEGTSTQQNHVSLSAAKVVLRFGVMMLVSLLTTYGSFSITALLNAANAYNVPFGWEMASGIMLKFKSILDCVILLNLPVVKKSRRKRKAFTSNPAINNGTATNDDLVSYKDTSILQLDGDEL